MDFVSGALLYAKCFRSQTVADAKTRECLALLVELCLKVEQVSDVMDSQLFQRSTPPDKIRLNSGRDSMPKALDH